jgi:flagellar basal-body rod modification protein FlgD
MQVSEVSSYMKSGAAMSQSAVGAAAAASIDTNQFLTLLMAQLTNQNPLEPLKDSEMLSQFAQLNSVEELRSIHTLLTDTASANQTGYAASLIGKTITANRASDEDLSGVVTSITVEAGKVYVHVGKEVAMLSDVVEIKG